jgi:hypothetical protein
MELMFSDKTPYELKKQVADDIEKASQEGVVDTEEVKYEKQDNGDVAITDKGTGEVTLASKDPEKAESYDLVAVPDGQLEKFVHPSSDGVTEGQQQGAPDEQVDSHMTGEDVIAPNQPDGGLNPEAGHEKSVEETAKEGPAAEGEVCPKCGQNPCDCEKHDAEKEFSSTVEVSSDNAAWQKIFSMPQEFCDYLFSEVIESAETSKVGDLKIEKAADEDNAVIVTSESTGDQCKVIIDDENFKVSELESKNFSEGEQFMPLFVVGVQPYDHIIVDAQEYDQDSAEQLKAQLEEDGVEAVQIFDNQDQAREYAINLLENLGADPAAGDVDEAVEQKEYCEHYGAQSFYTYNYRTNDTVFMSRLFSEHAAGIADTRDQVEEAINSGKTIDLDGATITPVDAQNAIIADGGEITKATLEGEDMKLEHITPDEASAITGNESIIEAESGENDQTTAGAASKECPEEEEKEFSEGEQWYSNEAETRFFSENEYDTMTAYMERLFSEESDQDAIEAAIEGGQPIETPTEIITPINEETAVVEDKGNGEFTKVTVLDEDRLNVHPLGEEDAKNLLGDGKQAPTKESENAEAVTEGEQKNYSNTRFFSEGEEKTAYMERLFSEEANQNKIEEAIRDGEQIENETEVITPINSTTAIIEDKENAGEFTKAEIKDEDKIEVKKITEEEADELTGGLKVEKEKDEPAEEEAPKEEPKAEEEKEEGEKEFSDQTELFDRYFAAIPTQQVVAGAPGTAPVAADPAAMALGYDPNAVAAAQAAQAQEAQPVVEVPSVEAIEDKALAAIQSIKAAGEEAAAQIMEAKAAPAATAEPEIQEAQFSEKEEEKTFSEANDTLISWLNWTK